MKHLYTTSKSLHKKERRMQKRKAWKHLKRIFSKYPKNKKPLIYISLCKYEKRKQKKHKNRRNALTKLSYIIFERHINFDKNIESVFKLEKDINNLIHYKNKRAKITINHTKLKTISLSALVFIVAHINRIEILVKREGGKGLKYNKKLGVNPSNKTLNYLFDAIGYWAYFRINKKTEKNIESLNNFLKVASSDIGDMELLKNIKLFIKDKTNFFTKDYSLEYQFDDILKEALGNALEHAYIKELEDSTKIKGKWWSCGHYNKNDRILTLVFYDYGVGIRESIKYNLGKEADRSMWDSFMDSINKDSELIKLAVTSSLRKYKRYKDKDRGKGLKRFQEFAKTCGYSSSFTLISGKGKYCFSYDTITNQENTKLTELSENISGTLIEWVIKI